MGRPIDVFGFRADITSLNLVSNGDNELEIDGLVSQVSVLPSGTHGAAVIVILDDGGPTQQVQIVDGVDVAFCGFPGTRQTTVPQTFAIAPADHDRIANLILLLGSVSPIPTRSSLILITFDGGAAPLMLFNEITADDGPLWDTLQLEVPIPALVSEVTVSVQSANEEGTCPSSPSDELNQSLSWIGAALSVAETGNGCTPGYWKQMHHFDSWEMYAQSDLFDDVFGVDAFGELTLLDALKQGGGKEKALGRHAVAALLNAASGGVSYLLTEAQVMSLVQSAFESGDFKTAKNVLEAQNELSCPLN